MRGHGFHFQAPTGWKIETTAKQATAAHGTDLEQVSTFPLVKPYSDTLFAKVATELKLRMNDLAHQTGGKVTAERTVTAGGRRAHAYDVTVDGHVDEYTFVLRGKREYLLLCRRPAAAKAGFCAQLVTSFAA